MSNPSSDMTEGTLRQRRNLLITSIVLIIYFFGKIKLGDELVIFGAAVKVGNPSALILSVVVAHFYFWVRFGQYVTADPFYNSEKVRYRATRDSLNQAEIERLARQAAGTSNINLPSYPHGYTGLETGNVRAVLERSEVDEYGRETLVDHPVEFDAPILRKRLHFKLFWSIYIQGKLLTDFALPLVLASVGVFLALLRLFA